MKEKWRRNEMKMKMKSNNENENNNNIMKNVEWKKWK